MRISSVPFLLCTKSLVAQYFEDLLDDPFDSILRDSSDEDWDADWTWEEDFEETNPDLDDLSDIDINRDSDLDIDPEGACKGDLLNHPECKYAEGKAICLWLSAADTSRWAMRFGSPDWIRPISSDCKAHLVEFLTNASNSPFEYFHDLRVECSGDLTNLCGNTTKEQTALACLRSNFDSISDSNCRDEITHLNSWTSLNVTWWSPSLWKDCATERRGVCSNHTSAGLEDLRDCLDDHREDLTDKCHHALFESDLQAAPSPYMLRRDLALSCRQESAKYCSDVVKGDENQLFCLYRASKRHADIFDPACADKVESVVKLLESDYRMNVPIRKFCRKTINEMCAKEKDLNDKADHESDEVLSCLKRVFLFNSHQDHISHGLERYEETEACMHAVRQSVLVDSLNWEVDSNLHSNCYHDYHRLLLEKKCDSSLAPQQCLQNEFYEIRDIECRKAVALHSQLSALDQDFKPQLLTACALTLDDMDCSEFQDSPDRDGLVECLYMQVNEIEDAQCRSAIRKDFSLSERDFRLSYELSLVCAKDRVSLCGSEAPEKVLACMIDRLDDIEDPHCHRDVARLSFMALNEGQDAVERSACAADVTRLCSSVVKGHGNVHACLLQNLGDVSSGCASAVLNLHKSSASHQATEKLLNAACSQELVEDQCRHLVKGQSTATGSLQAKVDCLNELLDDETDEFSQECEAQLRAVETLISSDYRTNPDLQKDCKLDVSVLCPQQLKESASSSSFSTEVIQCLIQDRGRVRNANCKKQILRQIYKLSDDITSIPDMRVPCTDDIAWFCLEIQPGDGRLHACLRDNMTELRADCQAQEFAIEQMEGLSVAVRDACENELNSFCKARSGSELHCLWRNVDEADQECQSAIKREMKGKVGNIWLDPALYTKCRFTVNQLIQNRADKCPSYLVELPAPRHGLIPLPSNYTQAIAGEHVTCVGSNRAKISDRACLAAVEELLRIEISDPVLMRFGLRTSCARELALNGVCGASDAFNTLEQWRCLQTDLDRLTFGCRDSVKRILKLSLVDVKFNPDIALNCKAEISSACSGLFGSKVFVCLTDRADRGDDVSEECREAIKRMPSPASVDMANVWSTIEAESKEDQLPMVEQLRLLRDARQSESGISISGPLAFVSLAALVLVTLAGLYRLYRYKMNKGYMVIVEKD